MSNKTLSDVQILLRNDTATNWTTVNPVLGKGEMGIEIDTGKFKFGDGVTTWQNLNYSGALVTASVTNGHITIDGVDTTVYELPTAGSSLGGVKSSTGKGKVTVEADGTMSVGSVVSADTAGALSSARTITISGDASGSTTFDGSANSTITIALVNSGVVAGSYTKVTVDSKGRVTAGDSLSASDIPTLTLSKISDAGTAAALDTGTTEGTIPVLGANGKLPDSVLPVLAINDTFPVTSEAEMLALTAQKGDIAFRSDTNAVFILTDSPASTLANWLQINVPFGGVTSVNGKAGVVVLSTDDVSEGTTNLYWTAARFNTAFSAKSSSDLTDGSTILHSNDTLILDCGNA